MNSYQNVLKRLGESVPKGAFACRELDLTKPEDAAGVAAQFGGVDRMAERYPGLHALFKRTVEAGPRRRTDNKGFQNMAKVLDLGYDAASGAPYAVGIMTLTAPAQRLYMTMDIFADGENVAHGARFFSGCVSGEIELLAKPMAPLPDGKLYTACLQATWESKKSGILRSQVASHEITAGARDLVKKVTVTHPKHVVSPPDGPITVAYARYDTQRDYVYPETRDKKTRNEMVMLDVEGTIELADGYHVATVPEGQAFLSCEGFGDIAYLGSLKYGAKGESGAVFFPDDEKKTKIGWKLETKWNNEILDSAQFGNRTHDLLFRFIFRCDEDMTPHQFLLTSKGTTLMLAQPHVEKISPIRLYWGCLAKGTKVMLADGTERNIEDLRPGDALRSPKGGAVVVKKIIPGTEENIYRVRLENGMEVRATRTHPLGTPDGFTAPIELNSDSRLATREGDSDVLYCYPETWKGPVYGVELETGDSFYADGVVSGTNQVMGALADSWADRRDVLEADREALEERDRLEADFQAGLL